MGTLFSIIYLLLLLYMLALVGRLILSWVQVFARDWRPRGLVLVLAEAVYTLTDPPLRFLRRLIPPLRLGGIALDLGFLLLFVAVSLAMQFAGRLAAM
ncbi:YggT family protein [Georgenia faecalis]|uniref:YggT family protein n=1 Tax=Georgenia faecalis TaxID=2483799 RepID=A0ABV9DEK0_9MICO|nr:YggT family protein [Georgenia faecalis]